MVVGLLGNESPDSNRFTPVTPKSENDVRLQARLGNQNPTGLPVGAVRDLKVKKSISRKDYLRKSPKGYCECDRKINRFFVVLSKTDYNFK